MTTSSSLSFPCAECLADPLHVRKHMSFDIPADYDWSSPSSDNYDASATMSAHSPFERFEKSKGQIDYSYHCRYDRAREVGVHNVIIDYYCSKPVKPLRSVLQLGAPT